MSKLVQIGDFTENGYRSVVNSGSWRAAYLNNTAAGVSYPTYFERHTTSDELFVLVQGRCKLLASAEGKTGIEILDMEPLVMYNVPSTTFHAVAMSPDCRILIVEDLDVGSENSEYCRMDEAEQLAVRAMIDAE